MPKDIYNPKLTIELIPHSLWGKNLRTLIPQTSWDRIRRSCYRSANYRCQICSNVGDNHPVECHEKWQYDDEKHVQKLIGVLSLCPLCHKVKHLGRVNALEPHLYETVVNHLLKINDWSFKDYRRYSRYIQQQHEKRDKYTWTIDIELARYL